MINFCRSSVDFNFGVLAVMKYETWSLGIINMTVGGGQWRNIIMLLMKVLVMQLM